MIDFPSSPTNGQVVTLGGNQYTYNLAKTQWQVTSPSVSTNLGGGSLGTIPYQSAVNTTAMLATSTAGYLLTSNGVGAAPSWQAAPVSLPTQTGNGGRLLTTDGSTASWSTAITISSGNLLLGATSGSGQKLYIAKNIIGNTAITVANSYLYMRGADIGYATGFSSTTSGVQVIQTYLNDSAGGLDLALNPSGGNVGIGTSVNSVLDSVNAARPLVVQSSSTAITAGSSTNAITISNSNTTTNNLSQLNFATITGASTNQYSAAWIACQYGARTNGQYPTGQLIFATSTALNLAPTEKARLTSAGCLSIGTTAVGAAGQILATGSITAMYSDKRLKENIKPITNALDKVDTLTGMLFTQNELAESFGYTDKDQQVGVFAQEVQKVLPEAVKLAPFDMDGDGNSKSGENYLTVQYEKLVPLLIEAIKELRAEVKELRGN